MAIHISRMLDKGALQEAFLKNVAALQPHICSTEVREDISRKKRFLSGIARMRGGGLPMPEFFGPISRSAFLVNKKSLFLQKCQCIELLTVF